MLAIQEVALGCVCSLAHLFPALNDRNKELLEEILFTLANQTKKYPDEKATLDDDTQSCLSNYLCALLVRCGAERRKQSWRTATGS